VARILKHLRHGVNIIVMNIVKTLKADEGQERAAETAKKRSN